MNNIRYSNDIVCIHDADDKLQKTHGSFKESNHPKLQRNSNWRKD